MSPDCEVIDVEQGTPEWLEARHRIFTASTFPACLADKKEVRLTIPQLKAKLKELEIKHPSTAKRDELVDLLPQDLALELASHLESRTSTLKGLALATIGEELNLTPKGSKSTERGHLLEPEARDLYSWEFGHDVEEVGFVKKGLIGFSPDGLLDDRKAGLEIKCLEGPAHLAMLEEQRIPWKYIPQVHGYFLAGLEWVDFFGYHPDFPYFYERVYPSSYTVRQQEGLAEVERYMREYADKFDIIL